MTDVPATADDDVETVVSARLLPLAQYRNLSRQVPVLYVLLAINATAVGWAYARIAPPSLTIGVPVVGIMLALWRIIHWSTPQTTPVEMLQQARTSIRRAEYFSVSVGLTFVAWAITLDRYGGPYEHAHITLFVAITVIGCIFCLTYAPRAARAVTLSVLGLYLPYCVLRGPSEVVVMAVDIAMVGLLVLKVQSDSFAAFVLLESSQFELRTERSQAQRLGAENALLAHTDALTGLPNRRHFFNRLDILLASAAPDTRFAVGVIDLDRFKPVNDTLGHNFGDRLLAILGERFGAMANDRVTVVRLGGDEFGLIITDAIEPAEAITARLVELVQTPFDLGEAQVRIGCSCGLAAYPEAGDNAHDLFDRADFALYHAKNQQRGGIVRFSEALEHLIRSEQSLESALQTADLARELTLAYQPIVVARTLQLSGLEALARWESPSVGAVPAEMLIATAERLGMARQVTLALFDRALADLALIPDHLRLSFNLSAADLIDPETINALVARIATLRGSQRRIILEITETSLIPDFQVARAALARLRSEGAAIAVDDFGTGYSSLARLNELPIDLVKIDRSFATRLTDPAGRRLMAAVRNLASALEVECVFEGIETEGQLLEATLAGFHYVQGYYLARPDRLDRALRFAASETEDHPDAVGVG